MVYPFKKLRDEIEAVYSELRADGTVKVYFEQPVYGGFHSIECILPGFEWGENNGFSEEELRYLDEYIHSDENLIMELARKRAEEDFKDGKYLLYENIVLTEQEGCQYCTPNEPESSSGEWLFDEMITEKGDLKGCYVGIVVNPYKGVLESNVTNSSGIGDTTIVVPIKYCPMCGRKMPDAQIEKQVIST